MSAGAMGIGKPVRDLSLLAPRFRAAVEAALAECHANWLDAVVYETFRSSELQAAYYARGRTVFPPIEPVTNAQNNLYSWHGYGLAVDVISQSRGWGAEAEWFEDVAACFRERGCRWGGEWKHRDLPHIQWGQCKPAPSDAARALIAQKGVSGVWDVVSAA